MTNSDAVIGSDYFVDGINTALSFPSYTMNASAGYQDVRYPFTDTSVQQGKFIFMRWTVTSAFDWRLLAANLYFEPEKELAPQKE